MNTAQDVVDHLLTSTGGGAQDGEHRAVRSAVVHGVREVFQTRQWLWHTSVGTFTTERVSTTATAMTSGSKTISVASTAGMAAGRILDFPAGYFSLTVRIVSISGNTVTVDHPALQTINILGTVANLASLPGEKSEGDAYNVTSESVLYRWSGTNWLPANTPTILVQTFYDLPPGVKDIDSLITETVGTLHFYLSPQEWLQLQINTRGAGEPYYYTIMKSDVSPDRYQIRFVGVPTNGTVVSYTYRYIPEPIRLMGYEPSCRQGTATVSANSASVTINGNTLPISLANTIIRFGTATTAADPLGALNPYVHERRIVSRNSDTTLTVSQTLPALTTVKYAISDVLDCSPQMYTAVLSAAEMWYARLAGKSGTEAMALFNRDLRMAMENDVVSPLSGRQYQTHYPTPRTLGYHSPIQNDIGG